MKKLKHLFSLIVSVVVLLSVCSVTTFATEKTYTEWTNDASLPRSGVYKLMTNVTLSSEVTIGSWGSSRPETPTSSLVLDLNGYTITAESGDAFFVQVTGGLTIEDSKGGGKITNAGSNSMGTLIQVNGGVFSMSGGILENTTGSGTALHINGNSVGTVTGGNIINNGSSGKAVFVNGTSQSGQAGGAFTLSGTGEVKNTVDGGDALYINGGNAAPASLKMEGGSVVQEGSYGSDAAIAVNGGASQSIIIAGGEITSNSKGIEAYFATVTVTGGTIDAATYAFFTRHTTVTPAEGSEVNVTAGEAIFYTLRDGSDNQINGGTFDAPSIKEVYSQDEPGDEPSKTVITGGSYTVSPIDYLEPDTTVLGYTEPNATKLFLVGTNEALNQKLASAPTGTQIDVLQGNANLSIPSDGVTVTNTGGGTVTVNNQSVTDGQIVTHTHLAVKVNSKAPTATKAGNITYWYCAGCGKYFSDEALTKEITKESTILAATGETEKPGQGTSSPDTGDSQTAVAPMILALAVVGICVFSSTLRRKTNKF